MREYVDAVVYSRSVSHMYGRGAKHIDLLENTNQQTETMQGFCSSHVPKGRFTASGLAGDGSIFDMNKPCSAADPAAMLVCNSKGEPC